DMDDEDGNRVDDEFDHEICVLIDYFGFQESPWPGVIRLEVVVNRRRPLASSSSFLDGASEVFRSIPCTTRRFVVFDHIDYRRVVGTRGVDRIDDAQCQAVRVAVWCGP